jgi:hypothetical protein
MDRNIRSLPQQCDTSTTQSLDVIRQYLCTCPPSHNILTLSHSLHTSVGGYEPDQTTKVTKMILTVVYLRLHGATLDPSWTMMTRMIFRIIYKDVLHCMCILDERITLVASSANTCVIDLHNNSQF